MAPTATTAPRSPAQSSSTSRTGLPPSSGASINRSRATSMEFRVALAALESGAFYGLIALGYYLFLRATTAVNFAMGAYVMFAGMTAASVVVERGWPQWLGVLLALAAAVALSWLAEAAILRPMLRRTR